MLFSHCVQLKTTAVTQENVAHSQEVGQHRKRINCLQMLDTILSQNSTTGVENATI